MKKIYAKYWQRKFSAKKLGYKNAALHQFSISLLLWPETTFSPKLFLNHLVLHEKHVIKIDKNLKNFAFF